jgi:hypothetical protein
MNKTVINPLVGKYISRPSKVERRGRPKLGQEIKPMLDANRPLISKLRQRRFSWPEIHTTLNNLGIRHSAQSLYVWKNDRFTKA